MALQTQMENLTISAKFPNDHENVPTFLMTRRNGMNYGQYQSNPIILFGQFIYDACAFIGTFIQEQLVQLKNVFTWHMPRKNQDSTKSLVTKKVETHVQDLYSSCIHKLGHFAPYFK